MKLEQIDGKELNTDKFTDMEQKIFKKVLYNSKKFDKIFKELSLLVTDGIV